MRWVFLLLLVLNSFYYVWRQQQAPMLPTDVGDTQQFQSQHKDIRLLSETPVNAVQKISEVNLPGERSACMFLGSFQLLGEAEILAQRLAGMDIQATTKELTTASGKDYWVYLPPLASKSASLRQLKELQARQIDSFIIAEGELANGISLGIFPRYDSAASVITRLTEAGYEPALREISRNQRSFWVRVEPQWVRLIDDALLASLAADFSELQHEVQPCDVIALGQEFE